MITAMITMNKTVTSVLCGILLVTSAGCASKTDLYMLQDDVKELKTQSQKSGGHHAEVSSEVERLRDEVAQLQGTIEELRYKLSASEEGNVPGESGASSPSESQQPGSSAIEKVTLPDEVAPETAADTAGVAPGSASAEAVPSSAPAIDDQGLYKAGKTFFEGYKYPSARKEFGLLLDTYPSSAFADDAQYYIAETYFNEKWFEKAILEYQLVIEKYPKGDKRPAAYLKQGLSFENIGDTTNAKVRYRELVQLYPESSEAQIVNSKMQ